MVACFVHLVEFFSLFLFATIVALCRCIYSNYKNGDVLWKIFEIILVLILDTEIFLTQNV